MSVRMRLFLLVLAAIIAAALWSSGCGSFRSICATGEDFIGGACVCKPGHVPDSDGKGCHVPDAPVTTTTTTTTSTSTTTTSTTSTTTTTLPPAGCQLPRMPECGESEGPTGVFGCCWTDKARPLPRFPFETVVEEVQDAIERERPEMFDRDGRADEAEYVDEVVRRLRAKGLCATRGGPGDEVGLKASNSESFQFDVHLGNGRPRHSGYVAACRPARFDD